MRITQGSIARWRALLRKAPFARGFFLGDYQALTVVGPDFRPVFVTAGPATGTSGVVTTTVGP